MKQMFLHFVFKFSNMHFEYRIAAISFISYFLLVLFVNFFSGKGLYGFFSAISTSSIANAIVIVAIALAGFRFTLASHEKAQEAEARRRRHELAVQTAITEWQDHIQTANKMSSSQKVSGLSPVDQYIVYHIALADALEKRHKMSITSEDKDPKLPIKKLSDRPCAQEAANELVDIFETLRLIQDDISGRRNHTYPFRVYTSPQQSGK